MSIEYFDRYKKEIRTEKVYGGKAVDFLYENAFGQKLAKKLIKPFPSKLLGLYHNSSLSRHKIAPFISNYDINIDEYVPENYKNFNSFFIRKFKDSARLWNNNHNIFPAFCEARYFATNSISPEHLIPVKGQYLMATSLLGSLASKWADTFALGPMILARLCPVDYHRFHFPDDGKVLEQIQIPGRLHSVNPKAISKIPDVFCTNERHVSILETTNFGILAYIEVGALGVGKIIQSHKEKSFKRGEEKGYFLFGGSTVIVLGEKNRFSIDQDILDYTNTHKETFIKLGDHLGHQ